MPEDTGFGGGGKPTRDPFSANADYDEDMVSRIEDAIDNQTPCYSHRGQWAVRYAWPAPRGIPEDIA
eukprot:10931603-Prorocentrum_lima.AAC.1